MSSKNVLGKEPDFKHLSDEKVKSFLDLTQQMLFAYNHDSSKTEVLEEMWRDLNKEHCQRLGNSAVKSIEADSSSESSSMLKRVPKLRRSPIKK